MDEAVRAFLTFLDVERGASRETLRNYASDLRQFVSFVTAGASGIRSLDPAAIQSDSVRAYLQWLDRKREKPLEFSRRMRHRP
jgi:site-specific recombinase XerD